jgi:hypothetical protein
MVADPLNEKVVVVLTTVLSAPNKLTTEDEVERARLGVLSNEDPKAMPSEDTSFPAEDNGRVFPALGGRLRF